MSGMQIYLRDSTLSDFAFLEPIKCLLPSRCTQAPLAAIRQADRAEVIAFGGGILKKFFGNDTSYGVVAVVFWAHPAVAITVEARKWLLGEKGEGFLEN